MAPVCILFNNNCSFTLPWSTVWTLRPESRCTFQLSIRSSQFPGNFEGAGARGALGGLPSHLRPRGRSKKDSTEVRLGEAVRAAGDIQGRARALVSSAR